MSWCCITCYLQGSGMRFGVTIRGINKPMITTIMPINCSSVIGWPIKNAVNMANTGTKLKNNDAFAEPSWRMPLSHRR